MKKRTFVLLEILIAFFLISLCAIPLVTGPLKLYKMQTKQLINMEKERLADWTFSEIKEQFLKNEIPWSKIPPKGEMSPSISLSPAKILIPNSEPREVTRRFVLKTTGEGETTKHLVRQLRVFIYLDEKMYEFYQPVLKRVKPPEPPNLIEK